MGSKVEEEAVMAKADAFKAELEVLRASHEVLATQMRCVSLHLLRSQINQLE
jgi:hypothetical protein